MVEPSMDAPFLDAYKMAFCSACSAREQLPLESLGHQVQIVNTKDYNLPIIRMFLFTVKPELKIRFNLSGELKG